MYIDIFTGYKIPDIYALLSNKKFDIYNSLFRYILKNPQKYKLTSKKDKDNTLNLINKYL